MIPFRFWLCLPLITLLWAMPLMASNKISSPGVTAGKTEVEYRGGWDHDARTRLNHRETHVFLINHGLTDRIRPELKVIAAKQGDDYSLSYTEWGLRYQLIKADPILPQMAVQATYDAAMQDHLPNRFEVGFLAARKFGDFPNTLNIGLENEYGTNARDGTRFNVNYRVQYAYSDSLVPGLEFYKGKGRLGTEPNGPKEVQLGPTLSGNLTENAKYDLGILWGLSNASPDNRFKWIVTYSF